MSSTKVKSVSYTLPATLSYAAGVLTVTTASVHNLVTGNTVNITAQDSPQQLIGVAVTVTSTTTFTVPVSTQWSDVGIPISTLQGNVKVSIFNTGNLARYPFTAPRSSGLAAVMQSFVIGTGGASYTVDGSLDGSHWTNIATVTHGTVSGDTQSATISPAWVYLSINITAIGAATSLQVNYSS